MQVQAFLDELARRLRDVENRQWDDTFLLNALNAAIRALCTVVPDAHTVHRDIALTPGSEQRIPDDTDRLVRVVSTVDPETGKLKGAVTHADANALDAMHPNWRWENETGEVRHWMVDDLHTNVYHVYRLPQVAGAGTTSTPVEPVRVNLAAIVTGDEYYAFFAHVATGAGDINLEDGATYIGTLPSDFAPHGSVPIAGWAGRVRIHGNTVYNTASLPVDFNSPAFDNHDLEDAGGTIDISELTPGGEITFHYNAVAGSFRLVDPNAQTDLLFAVSRTLDGEYAFVPHVASGAASIDLFDGTVFTATLPDDFAPSEGYDLSYWDYVRVIEAVYDSADLPGDGINENTDPLLGDNNLYRMSIHDPRLIPGGKIRFFYNPSENDFQYLPHAEYAITAGLLRAQLATTPHATTAPNEDLPLGRQYHAALFEYALYYAYAVDDEGSPNTARANRHYLAFYQLLNKDEDTRLQIDVARQRDEQ